MDKITLQEISAYLPYRLKAVDYFDGIRLEREVEASNIMTFVSGDTKAKPLLRPLSNYKEIASEAMNKLNIDLMDQISLQDFSLGNQIVENLDYGVVKECLKNHIDIFNLIPRGLAVEIKE